MSSPGPTHTQGRKRCTDTLPVGAPGFGPASRPLTYIQVFSLTGGPQSPWTRVCPSLQGDSGQRRWSLCWPGRTRWTA